MMKAHGFRLKKGGRFSWFPQHLFFKPSSELTADYRRDSHAIRWLGLALSWKVWNGR